MNLALRDRIAEWLIEALERPERETAIRALVHFAEIANAGGVAIGLSPAERGALASEEGLFEPVGERLRLRSDLLADLQSLRRRAALFADALRHARRCGPSPAPRDPEASPFAGGPPRDEEVTWALCAAAALFNVGLFFEVHEILEPVWGRSQGTQRSFLQGLIQVAVGLHHHGNGNVRGALSLLTEGNDKLRPLRPSAFGVELDELCAAVDQVAREIHDGRAAASIEPPRLVLNDS